MNVSECSFWNTSTFRPEWTRYLTLGILSLFPVFTITGNLLVIVTVVTRRRFQWKTNSFVISLAIADLAVGIFVMPFAIFIQFQTSDYFKGMPINTEKIICSLAWSLDVMLTTTSILHLMCMTIDRYLAISLPIRYHSIMNRNFIIILLIMCWTIPIIISFGLIFGEVHTIGMDSYEIRHNVREQTQCIFASCEFKVSAVYAISASIISFYLPSIFMLFCNIKLFRNVRRRGSKLRELTSNYIFNSQREHQIHTELKVARTIAFLLTDFFICWLPFFVVNITDPFVSYSIPATVWSVVTWLGYVNSAINPYLYYVLNMPKTDISCQNAQQNGKQIFIQMFRLRKQYISNRPKRRYLHPNSTTTDLGVVEDDPRDRCSRTIAEDSI